MSLDCAALGRATTDPGKDPNVGVFNPPSRDMFFNNTAFDAASFNDCVAANSTTT
jgi:hypothetical protein